MSDDIRHGEYMIHPTPRQPNGAGPWLAELQVARTDTGGGTRVQLFNGPATFPTRAEAVAACVQLGRDILDEKVPGRAVLF
jgi:hypothetical protein